MIEIYSLTVLNVISLKSRCQQGYISTKGSRGECISCSFRLLVARHHQKVWLLVTLLPPTSVLSSYCLLLSLACGYITPSSTSCLHVAFCLCVYTWLTSYRNNNYMGLRAHPLMQYNLILIIKTLSLNKITF